MKKQSVLVLWSGGLDSTYLIYKMLCDGYRVKAFYINIQNNTYQTEREKTAIQKMIPIFKQWDFEYLGELIDINILNPNSKYMLNYPPLFLLVPYVMGDVDNLAIGYVMNDDAISYIEDIKNIYNSIQPLCSADLPKLIFPLSKYKKEDIWNKLIPPELRQHVTWCENSACETVGKDNCPSCQRMSFLDVDKIVDGYILDSEFIRE